MITFSNYQTLTICKEATIIKIHVLLELISHSTGDRNETYRHLGFLVPSDLQGQNTISNHSLQVSGDHQSSTHIQNEWSQWFGHPSGFQASPKDG